HRDLHAHLHPAAAPLRREPAVLRAAGGAEPADGLPVAAGGDVGLLPEGGEPAARDAEPDLPGHAALHGDPDHRHRAAVHVAADRPVAALRAVRAVRRVAPVQKAAPAAFPFGARVDVDVNVNYPPMQETS